MESANASTEPTKPETSIHDLFNFSPPQTSTQTVLGFLAQNKNPTATASMQRRQEWQTCSQNNISSIIDVDALDKHALKNSIMVKTSSANNCFVNRSKIINQSTLSSSTVSNIAENNRRSHPEHFTVSSFLTGYNFNATFSQSTTKPKEARQRDRAYSQPFLTIEHNSIPRPRLPLSQPHRSKTQNLSPSRMALVQMQDAPRHDTLMLKYRKPSNPARLIAEQRRNNTIPFFQT